MENFTFESGMDELEPLVRDLESGSLPLEASLQAFERGMALKKRLEDCSHKKFWWIIILYFLIFQFGQLVKNSSMSFYVRWMFDSVINSANPEQTSGALMSTLGLVGGIPTDVGMVVAWPIARNLERKEELLQDFVSPL